MRILLINHYAGSELHGMEFRPHQLARHWAQAGHDVTVVAGSFSHLRNKNPVAEACVTQEMIAGVRYRWIRTRKYSGNGIDRILNIFDFIRGLYKENRGFLTTWIPDAVIASSTYPFDIYPARKIARRVGAKLIWEVHDLWPLSPIELGGYSRWHPFIVATQVAEDACCRSADAVVSILPKAIEHLSTRGLPASKYYVVQNGAEVNDVEATIQSAFLLPHNESTLQPKQRPLTVGFAGSHNSANSIDTLLKACSIAGESHVNCLLIGEGPEKPALISLASAVAPRQVTFAPRVERQQALKMLRCCDAIYVGLRKKEVYQFGISMNKIFDAMLCERPILASFSAGNNPVADAGCGLTVPAEDAVALAGAITEIYRMSETERLKLGARGTRFLKENHCYADLARKFLWIINDASSSE